MNLKYFFTNEATLAEAGLDIGFELYSIGHLLWLAGILAAGIWLSGWYRKQGEGRRKRIRKVFAAVLGCSEICRDTVLIVTGVFSLQYLPFHLCGLAIFGLLADAFWEKQQVTKQMIAYAFMPGAVSALLFCNWTSTPFLNFFNIHSFAFHAWIFFYFLMRYRAGEIQPEYKGLWETLAVLLVLVYPLFRLNAAVGSNYMFLNEASEGSPLIPLWNLFGETHGHLGYILACIVLVAVVFHVLYGVYRLLAATKRSRRAKSAVGE